MQSGPDRLPAGKLGTGDLPPISRVGLGTWAFGGNDWSAGWGPQDDHVSIQTVRNAARLGVNWIDTAPEYGLGHAEEVVGRAIRSLPPRDRPLVFTKCGLVWGSDRSRAATKDLSPTSIRRECVASLVRLKLEVIDLYQIHWPDTDTRTPLAESWDALLKLKSEGYVRALGVSNFSTAQLEECFRRGGLTSLQPPLSLIDKASLDEVIPWCFAHTVGVIVYSPMHSGLLTDKASHEWLARLPESDWRRSDADFAEPRFSKNLATRDRLLPIAARHGCVSGAVAIAWALAQPGVTGAICGARSPGQLPELLKAATLGLSAKDLSQVF